MNPLAQRKQLLIAQGELQRAMMLIERQQWMDRRDAVRDAVKSGGWWLLGATALAGYVVTTQFGRILKWAPIVFALVKSLQGAGGRRRA